MWTLYFAWNNMSDTVIVGIVCSTDATPASWQVEDDGSRVLYTCFTYTTFVRKQGNGKYTMRKLKSLYLL
jgi:hypothetical protein